MTVTSLSAALSFPRRMLGWLLVGVISWIIATLIGYLQEFSIWVVVLSFLTMLTIWRPRYGLYSIIVLAVTFEAHPDDPFMFVGWVIQSNVSMWSPVQFFSFSTIEILAVVTAVVVIVNAIVEQRTPRSPQLMIPLLAFLTLIFLSLGYGLISGGNLNIALWEVRSLFLAGLITVLVPNVITNRGQVLHIFDLILFSVILLSLDLIWRRYVHLADYTGPLDLKFEHETPTVINVVVILLLARLIWPATMKQRLMVLFVPLLLFAQMVTERRASWIGLDLGLVLIAIFVFRLRRKVFYFLVLPLCLIYLGYLGAFWNATGPLAQPARAVRSINSPDARDAASNIYRYMETANARANIKANPLFGLGYGKEYVFYHNMPDLSWWPFWRYIPHNNILWLWMKMGPLGFFMFLTLVGAGMVRGVQVLCKANRDRTAPVLVALISTLMMLMTYYYVDLGMVNVRTTVLLGFSLGVIGMWGKQVAGQERVASQPSA